MAVLCRGHGIAQVIIVTSPKVEGSFHRKQSSIHGHLCTERRWTSKGKRERERERERERD